MSYLLPVAVCAAATGLCLGIFGTALAIGRRSEELHRRLRDLEAIERLRSRRGSLSRPPLPMSTEEELHGRA